MSVENCKANKQFLTADPEDVSSMHYYVDVYIAEAGFSNGDSSFCFMSTNSDDFCEKIDSIINFLVEAKRAVAIRNVQQEQGET